MTTPRESAPLRRFKVTTWEHVEGSYAVEAATEADARELFERGPNPRIAWDEGVEQTDYTAFDLEVRAVEEV